MVVWSAASRGREASLDGVDARPEHGKVLPQRGEILLQALTPSPIIKQGGFDPAQRLGDRDILLLQAIEPPIQLVEVAEYLRTQFVEAPVNGLETPVHDLEAPVDGLEALVNRLETFAEEGDEILVL